MGAFNIQVFGVTKASKPDIMDVLGRIIRTYDVVAIQEIRDKSQTALPALVDVINSGDPHYEYVVSKRLGRTTCKEQYAYIYNNQTVADNSTSGRIRSGAENTTMMWTRMVPGGSCQLMPHDPAGCGLAMHRYMYISASQR